MRLILAALLIAITGPSVAAETLSGRPRIVDGDTIAFGDDKVRLNGIDAPETHQLCQDWAGGSYSCGLKATAALIGEIGSAEIECRGDKRDRYQRLVATCWKGGEDLNRWMVAEGFAVAFRRYSTVYVDAEEAARTSKRGLWAGDFEMPWDWRKQH